MYKIIIKVLYLGKGSEILIKMGIKLVWDSLGIKILIDRTPKLSINGIREINRVCSQSNKNYPQNKYWLRRRFTNLLLL
jgi:hypothetical protein